MIGWHNHLHSFPTHILRTAFQRFPTRCCTNSWPTRLSHEKFWPMSHKCLWSRTILIRTPFLQATGCNSQYGHYFGVLLAKCTHDRSPHLWIMRILQYLSSWNTVRLQLLSGTVHTYNICSKFLLGELQFVLHILKIEILLVQNHSKVCVCVLISHDTNDELDGPFTTGPHRSIVTRVTFSTHFFDCSVKTELIYRSNCAKNSYKRVQVGTKVDR